MSVQAIGWALAQDVKPAMAKLVLIALANYANDKNQCWPSKASLARDCSSDRSTVCKYLRALREAGIITVQERQQDGVNQTSIITLVTKPDGNGSRMVGNSPLVVGDAPSGMVGNSPQGVVGQERGGGGPCATGVVGQARHKPSLNRQEPAVVARERSEPAAGAQPKIDFNGLHRKLIEAGGEALNRTSASLETVSDPIGWIEGGADLERDILPVIRAKAGRAKPQSIRHWRYFADAVAEAVESRKRGLPAVAAPDSQPVFRVSPGTVRFAKPSEDYGWLEKLRAKNEQRRVASC